MTEVWICGKVGTKTGWDIQGVFSSEALAVAACRSAEYFIGPLALDVALPDESSPWPRAYWPLSKLGEIR